MMIYLVCVIVACAILPFVRYQMTFIVESKQSAILHLGRLLRQYQQTGDEDILQCAQVVAYSLQKAGVNLSEKTQLKLLGA